MESLISLLAEHEEEQVRYGMKLYILGRSNDLALNLLLQVSRKDKPEAAKNKEA